MRKSFILGLGAQKAGTTWFYEYLKSDPRSAMGALKEYHVWDALHIPSCRHFLQTGSATSASEKQALRRRLQTSEEAYFDYFENLVRDPVKQLTADITPSYSGLKRDVLERIRRGCEGRGIECKAVFFMRDPVDRCWSLVRMLHSRKDRRVAMASSLEGFALKYARTRAAAIRTRYEKIIPEIEAVFSKEHVYIGLYETMFTPQSISALSAFAGVENKPQFVETKFNVSAESTDLSEEARVHIARDFKSTYEFVIARWPQTAALWRNARLI